MIYFKDVNKVYDNGSTALSHVTVHINKGEFVFVVGASGAGKSTFIKLLSHEEVPTSGSVIVNGFASVGKNCRIHGAVCIGNRGIGQTDEEKTVSPTIGDNVDIGVGVSIIGDVHIADDTKIGAGAVVVKSCNELGKTLVGVPAHPIN